MKISTNLILNTVKKKKINSSKIKTRNTRQLPYDTELMERNLRIPWAIAISNVGSIYFTERGGSLRVIRNGLLQRDPMLTLQSPFISEGEGGLMGIALDPDFSQNHYRNPSPGDDRIVRLTLK